MVITNKLELQFVADFLIKYANNSDDPKVFAAFGNVSHVLQQAISAGGFDAEHDAYVLQVIKLPNAIDYAIEKCCSTDCVQYRLGVCPYVYSDKYACIRIKTYMESDEDID